MPTTAPTPATRETTITASDEVPMVTIVREFDATPDKVRRAHTDPDLLVRWLGPDDVTMEVDRWDCRSGGEWRYVHRRGEEEYGFHGCFHEVRDDRLVQTFTFEGFPDGVALETMTFEALDGGRCRLVATSLVDSFEARDAFLASGMETGVVQGYNSLDTVLAEMGG